MKIFKTGLIKEALESDIKHADPSRDIWSEVEAALALPAPKKINHSRLHFSAVAFFAALFILSTAAFAAANTAQGKDVIDWVFERFGIHLVANTPQVTDELKQVKVQKEFVQGTQLDKWAGKLPEGLKMPAYLPNSMGTANASVYQYSDSLGIRWSNGDEKSAVELFYREMAYGKGSVTLTNGEASDIKEVKIGDLTGMAFHDDTGWNIDWVMNGHQYMIRTQISLEEALKVAESIK